MGVAQQSSNAPASQPSWEVQFQALAAHAKEIESQLGAFDRSNNPTIADALDNVRLRIEQIHSVSAKVADKRGRGNGPALAARIPELKASLDYYFEALKAGKDPHRGKAGGLRAMRSKIDGELLSYDFWLPNDYDPKKKYPLEVRLHSGGGVIWKADTSWGIPVDQVGPYAAFAGYDRKWSLWKNESIIIHPCGRGQNDYCWIGHRAVMEVIEDVQRRHLVDDDLITLCGGSMGADGALRLGALYPDTFSAVYILSGGIYFGTTLAKTDFDTSKLAQNFANVPVAMAIGGKDGYIPYVIPFYDDLAKAQAQFTNFYPHRKWIDPDRRHEVLHPELIEESRVWMGQQKPRNKWPKLVNYKSLSLRYDGAYWARIDMFEDASEPASILADARTAGKIAVTPGNVLRFHLDLDKGLVGDLKQIEVAIAAQEPLKAPCGGTVFFAKENDRWSMSAKRYPEGLVKKNGLSGRISDVFMEHPVLLVYPTHDVEQAASQLIMDNFVKFSFGPNDGWIFLHRGFDRKADGDITEKDIADRNLVIFGDPTQNKLLARIIKDLPVSYDAQGFEIGGKKYTGADTGLIMVYPNPLNPRRYILLAPSIFAKCDGVSVYQMGFEMCNLGDWAVLKLTPHWTDTTWAVPQVGGYFNSFWQLPEPSIGRTAAATSQASQATAPSRAP